MPGCSAMQKITTLYARTGTWQGESDERERERGGGGWQESEGVATVKPRPEYSFAVCCFNNTRNPSSNFQNFNPMSLIHLPTLHSPLFTPLPPRSSQLHSHWFVCCILPCCCCCCTTSCCCCCCCCGLLQCWWWVDLISHVGIIDSSFCAVPPSAGKEAPSAGCKYHSLLLPLPRSVSFSLSPSLSYSLQLRPNQSSSTAAKPPTGRSVVF